ncbi:hypothetical protein D3C85_1118950 [compost metagenome]
MTIFGERLRIGYAKGICFAGEQWPSKYFIIRVGDGVCTCTAGVAVLLYFKRCAVTDNYAINCTRSGDVGSARCHAGGDASGGVYCGNTGPITAPAGNAAAGHILTSAIRHARRDRKGLAQSNRHRLDARAHVEVGDIGASDRQCCIAANGFSIHDGSSGDARITRTYPGGQSTRDSRNIEAITHPAGTISHRQARAIGHQCSCIILLSQTNRYCALGWGYQQAVHGCIGDGQLRVVTDDLTISGDRGMQRCRASIDACRHPRRGNGRRSGIVTEPANI